jgi:enoyl-CoA hydratase
MSHSPKGEQNPRDAFGLAIDKRGVATLAINSGKINVLDSKMVSELTDVVEGLALEKGIRCLVLRGNDRAFVGGADIREMATLNATSAREFITRLHRLCSAVHSTPFPVIARIHGWCFGVGAELAAASDIRVGSSESFYAMPEVKIGIPSVIHASLLPQIIGAGRARWWVLTGQRIDSTTALDWGFLSGVAQERELDGLVETIVADIRSCPPNAIRLQKQLCNDWESDFPDRAAEASIATFGHAYESEEPSLAMHEFLHTRQR